MDIEIREFQRGDQEKAIRFAITGMHFDWYLKPGPLLDLFGRYFWTLELCRATQALSAWADGELAGVLLVEMKGEPKRWNTPGRRSFLRAFQLAQGLFARRAAGDYDRTNQDMFRAYAQNNTPDGELVFLAADPKAKTGGIGTALLAELARREAGKRIFLYTDSGCTYQFYEHRGFTREQERDIVVEIGKRQVPLRCFLYSRRLENPSE